MNEYAKKYPITPQQIAVVEYCIRHRKQHGNYPTRLEIAAAFGWKSPNAATVAVKALTRKGYMSQDKGLRIVLTKAARNLGSLRAAIDAAMELHKREQQDGVVHDNKRHDANLETGEHCTHNAVEGNN